MFTSWSTEHRFALITTAAGGAGLGLAIGELGASPSTFAYYLSQHADDAAIWAALGALVSSALFFAARTLMARAH